MLIRRRRRIASACAAIAAALTLTLTACGGASSEVDPGSAPIRIMFAGQFSGDVPLPQQEAVATVAVDRINAAGGVNGRMIEMLTCDDRRDPNLAAQCARTAVQENVVAYVSAQNNFADVMLPTLEAAGIPFLRGTPAQAVEFESPLSFPLLGGAISYGGAMGLAMADDGCRAPAGIGTDVASAQFLLNAVSVGLSSAGGATMLPPISAPVGTPDFAPIAQALAASGVDCVAFAIPPADSLRAAEAIRQADAGARVYAALGVVDQSVIDTLNGTVDMLVVSDYPTLADTSITALDQYRKDADEAGVAYDNYSCVSWYLISATEQVLSQITGEITASAVLAQLNATTSLDIAGGPELDFSTPFDVPKYARLFNRQVHVQDVEGTTLVERDQLVDVSDFYRRLAETS
jgi:ABC-type branched-subunit amino acid transport system substrate-binding protein